MNQLTKNIIISLMSIYLLSCQQLTPIKPFKKKEDTNVSNFSQEEKNRWYEAQLSDELLRQLGALYIDEQANAYVQDIIDRLYPEFKGKLKIRFIKDSRLNAFALQNGSIYIHIGLLARIENEAQLATVLGHEAVHFINKHNLKKHRERRSANLVGLVFNMAGGGILPQILLKESLSGYSRELEREADKYAFHKMQKVGYDLSQGVAVFQKLMDEAKAYKIKRPFLFSSHPKLKKRIESFKQLIATHGSGGDYVGKHPYIEKTMAIREAVLNMDLTLRRYQSVILVLENPKNREMYPKHATYYLAEAYRQRGEKGDLSKALALYLQVIDELPNYAPAYKSLGFYYYKNKNYQLAENAFTHYLKLSPQGQHVEYVQYFLNKINNSGLANEN